MCDSYFNINGLLFCCPLFSRENSKPPGQEQCGLRSLKLKEGRRLAYLSIYQSICLSILLFIYLSIYLSICLCMYDNNQEKIFPKKVWLLPLSIYLHNIYFICIHVCMYKTNFYGQSLTHLYLCFVEKKLGIIFKYIFCLDSD